MVAESDTKHRSQVAGEEHMTPEERVMRASAGRAHLGMLMDWFEALGNWEAYFRACNLFHMYDELLKDELKEQNNDQPI